MTLLVISVLRLGGLAVGALGVILTMVLLPVVMKTMQYGPDNAVMALPAFFPALYLIITGAALYAFGEVVSLLAQIKDRLKA